jgi:hypothetical protein
MKRSERIGRSVGVEGLEEVERSGRSGRSEKEWKG